MDIIKTIRAEIERLKGICAAQIKVNPGQTFPFVMEMTGYDKLLSFLDTLQEPEVDLDDEIERRYDQAKWGYVDGFGSVCMDKGQFTRIARHFYNLGKNAK